MSQADDWISSQSFEQIDVNMDGVEYLCLWTGINQVAIAKERLIGYPVRQYRQGV